MVLRPRRRFRHQTGADIDKAIERVQSKGQPITHGRVVAELSFGFWRYLLTKRYTDPLWIPHLRHAFPHTQPGLDRARVDTEVDALVKLRNRIAHHEHIFNRDLDADAIRALGVIGWVCKDTRDWIKTWSRIPAVLKAKPT